MDVYEHESGMFYEDYSELFINDDELLHLINLPNVIVTSHQAFLTQEALNAISKTTASNIHAYAIDKKRMKKCSNSVNEVEAPAEKNQVKSNATSGQQRFKIESNRRHYSTSSNDSLYKLKEGMVPIPRTPLAILSSL